MDRNADGFVDKEEWGVLAMLAPFADAVDHLQACLTRSNDGQARDCWLGKEGHGGHLHQI